MQVKSNPPVESIRENKPRPQGAWTRLRENRRNNDTCSWTMALLSVDCKTVRIFAYSSTREQSNKRSGMRLKTESETGEYIEDETTTT